MDASEWDARYSSTDLVWGTEPNRFVAAELADLPPGRALDVACGEGRNAIWLARRGWFAVGVDFSAAAIDRARQLAQRAEVDGRTTFVVGDVTAGPLPAGQFDAVVVAYLQLPVPDRTHAIRTSAERVTKGGTLLVVGHDATNLADGFGGPQDPAVLFTPDDIVTDLGEGFLIAKTERVHRPVDTPDGERIAIDALVVATALRN
jgi:SAM-dependent methyltransferase